MRDEGHITGSADLCDAESDDLTLHQGAGSPMPKSSGWEHFGPFEILPSARALLLNGLTVELGSRAFDVFMTLYAARGQIVSKEAITRDVWPSTIVEESNLRVQLSCLRRALGAERWRVKTVPGKGYLLTGEARSAEEELQQRRAPIGKDQAPIVIIDMSFEGREILRCMLSKTGARVESYSSLAAFLVTQDSRRGDLVPL